MTQELGGAHTAGHDPGHHRASGGLAAPGSPQPDPRSANPGPAPLEWASPDAERPDLAERASAPVRLDGITRERSGERDAWHPGSVPLRPLDVGDILDGTFSAVRRSPRATLGLSAALISVQQLLLAGAQVATGDLPTASGVSPASGPLRFVGGLGGVIGLVLSGIIGAVLTGMIVVVVSDDVLGRKATVAGVWRRVRPRLWALVAASAAISLLPFLGLLLFIVPGVILWTAWSLTVPALVLERLGPIRALRRSWRLAWPDFWRVFGLRGLSVLLGSLMQYLVVIPFAVIAGLLAVALGAGESDQLPFIAWALIALGSITGGMISQPFLAGVLTLLYVDRRMRAEGLDIALQLQRRRAGALRRTGADGDAGGDRSGASGGRRPVPALATEPGTAP
jgi:hypothetical protein